MMLLMVVVGIVMMICDDDNGVKEINMVLIIAMIMSLHQTHMKPATRH